MLLEQAWTHPYYVQKILLLSSYLGPGVLNFHSLTDAILLHRKDWIFCTVLPSEVISVFWSTSWRIWRTYDLTELTRWWTKLFYRILPCDCAVSIHSGYLCIALNMHGDPTVTIAMLHQNMLSMLKVRNKTQLGMLLYEDYRWWGCVVPLPL